MTLVCKSARKHSDADCLSRVPVELSSERPSDDNEDSVFLGGVNAYNMTELQRDNPDLRPLTEYLEDRHTTLP